MTNNNAAYDVFCNISNATFDYVTNAHELNVQFGEEALTSLLLLTLKSSALAFVACRDFTKTEESRFGADLELWLGTAECGWLRYGLQAKKIKVSTRSYQSLRHKVNGEHQIDLLTNYCRRTRSIPGYLFYNGGLENVPTFSLCADAQIRDYGVSFAYIERVRPAYQLRQSKSFYAIHDGFGGMPWQCLVNRHCDIVREVRDYNRQIGPRNVFERDHQQEFWWSESLPELVAGFLSGAINEAPRDLYPNEGFLPRRIIAINLDQEMF